jgi:hypothetical protein
MKYTLYLNGMWSSESIDLTHIMAVIRAAMARDWCTIVRIEKRVSATLCSTI